MGTHTASSSTAQQGTHSASFHATSPPLARHPPRVHLWRRRPRPHRPAPCCAHDGPPRAEPRRPRTHRQPRPRGPSRLPSRASAAAHSTLASPTPVRPEPSRGAARSPADSPKPVSPEVSPGGRVLAGAPSPARRRAEPLPSTPLSPPAGSLQLGTDAPMATLAPPVSEEAG